MITTLQKLIKIINTATKEQIDKIIYEYEYMGFYREDKRERKKFIIDCLKYSYNNVSVEEQLEMAQAILKIVYGK